MNMKKFNRIFSLILVLALLVSCLPTVFAAEKKNDYTVDEEELIVADWLWGSVIDERGADVMMKEYADAGFTDIYLLLKGTGGSTSWNSSVPGSNNTYSYDLLQSVLDAARPYGIRIHAWLMAAHDKAYMKNHPEENYYHFRYGYSDTVNQYVNLRGKAYQEYFVALVKELCANYPDLAGIHLDTIRYGGIYYDWGAEAREVLINKYGITKAEYNAAAKAMAKDAGYSACTTNSDGYVIYGSGTSLGSYYFSSAMAGSGSTDVKNGVKKVLQMRLDTVNDFIKIVREACPGKILSTAIMPDTSIDGAYAQAEYGQQPKTMAPLVDYICTMSYASTYGKGATWPKELCQAITNVGGNVVAAIQFFPNEDGSNTGPSNQRIYDEIYGAMQLRDTVNKDTNDSTGKVLGYAIFRAGFGVYGGVHVNEKEGTLEFKIHNNDRGETTGGTKQPLTKLVITMLDGVTVENISNKQGWGNATFTTSSDKKTITISGSFLQGTGSSTFTVNYKGTVNEVTGAAKMDATNSYGRVYTTCATIANKCAHEYAAEILSAATCETAGQTKYTCALCQDTYTETVPALGHAYEESFDEATLTKIYTCANCGDTFSSSCAEGHTRLETWALTENTHFAFCYNCEIGYSEGCHFVETARTEATCTQDGSVTYTCAGTVDGVHDAYSGMGCGNTYTEVIPAGHSYGTSVDNGDGTHAATCAKCGEKVTEKHTEKVLEGKAATCTESGLTEGKVCSTCNAVIVAQEVIPAKGHTETTTAAVPATCTENGATEGKVCSVCGEVLVAAEIIPAKGHKEVVVPGTPATCTTDGVSDTIYCSECGETLQTATKIPATGHSFTYIQEDEDGHIKECTVCFFSDYVPHEFVNGECVCGETDGTAAEPTVDSTIKFNHTLNLASDISVNFAINAGLLQGFDMSKAYVEATIDTASGKQTVKLEPVLSGYYYYFTFNGLNATMMNDKITAVFHGTKNGVPFISNPDVYSVATYAYAQLNKTSVDPKLQVLCANLLRYGANAQTYKNYRVNALADSNMTAAHKALLTDLNTVAFDNVNQIVGDIAGASVTFQGKALTLDSKVTIKYIVNLANYTGKIEDLTLRINYTDINGQTKTASVANATVYNAAAKLYAFDFDGLLAAELRQTVSAAVYSGNTRMTGVQQYSASTYGNNKVGGLLTLCQALMAYSDAARDYFAK